MNNALLIRKIVEDLAKEVQDWDIKSSNMHSSDADGWIGFRKDIEENEYDPRTGKLVKNDEIGDHVTYLQQWDSRDSDQPYLEDEKRDNGIGYQMNAMDQITSIK